MRIISYVSLLSLSLISFCGGKLYMQPHLRHRDPPLHTQPLQRKKSEFD